MENYNENNIVKIGGKVVEEAIFSHELYEEKFYLIYIETKRFSEYHDKLPVIVSERLIDVNKLKIGTIVKIEGQFRSYNKITEGKSKLVLSIFAKNIEENNDEKNLTLNEVMFKGYICKDPIYRKTPLGREIADVLIAVNRSYRKSDYIPCILWGRNAKFCKTLDIGSTVKLMGRIQSRIYEKKKEDGMVSKKTAYEVSISKFSIANDTNEKIKKEDIIE